MEPALRVALYVSAARRIRHHISQFLSRIVPLIKELRVYQLAAVVQVESIDSSNDFVVRRVKASHRLMSVIESLRQWSDVAFDDYQRNIFDHFFKHSDEYWKNALKELQKEASRRIELFSAVERIYCSGFEMTAHRQ